MNGFLNSFRLDPSQEAFCKESSDYVRLLAPAGCGKTSCLLWRCLFILKQEPNLDKDNVRFLVVTFTRAARDELRERVKTEEVFSEIRSKVDITTLNAYGYKWLKSRLINPKLITENKDRYFCMMNLLKPVWINHPKIAQVLSDNRRGHSAARSLMELLDSLKGLGFRHDKHNSFSAFEEHIEWLHGNGMRLHVLNLIKRLEDLEIISEDPKRDFYKYFFQFWCSATQHMYSSSVLTLEDQKYWCLIELESNLQKTHGASRRLRYLLVDEFQDINPLDLNLLRVIARTYGSGLTIVGDDDQAIYEWRGATPQFILNPGKYIGASFKTYVLEVNYRSPRNIVEHSQKLIAHNKRRVPKEVRSKGTTDADIKIIECAGVEECVEYVHAKVRELLALSPSKRIALIGRKRSQIIPYQIVFAGDGIQFCAAEDLNILLSEAFNGLKKILALKAQKSQPFPLGPDPVEGLLAICDKVKRYPLSKDDRGHLRAHLMLARPRTIEEALEALYQYRGPLKGSNRGGEMAASFYQAIKEFLQAESVSETIYAISEHFDGLQKDYGRSLDDIFYADPPFLYLADFAHRYGKDFQHFLRDVEGAIGTLVHVQEIDAEDTDPVWKRPVHLMTALRAKGKEFSHVFVLDCNDGVWPSGLVETEEDLEEERRLFYVAVTRAQESLTLLVNKRILGRLALPTPYLSEMGLR
jgi:DNA helicase-2/ATP-dependent DNA helicase PcrA